MGKTLLSNGIIAMNRMPSTHDVITPLDMETVLSGSSRGTLTLSLSPMRKNNSPPESVALHVHVDAICSVPLRKLPN
ncbi:hypothetical protein RUM44_002973 [Polyplax serrata]|uniref:Uncharacterized protein n=1 Tax=Polyplax serrata TaxID=468196 RepID=A0ABR1AYP2_POLSC